MSIFRTLGLDLAFADTEAGPHGADLIFDNDVPGAIGGFDSIVPGAPGPARGSAGFIWDNTSHLPVLNPAGNQPYYAVGLDVQLSHAEGIGTAIAQSKMIIFADEIGPILALELQTDGTIVILDGGDLWSGTGTPVGRTTAALLIDTWYFLELEVEGFGGAATVRIWLDDNPVPMLELLGVTLSANPRQPDRVWLCDNNGTQSGVNTVPFFGFFWDNVYMLDGTGPAPCNTRLGPICIESFNPAADLPGRIGLGRNITSPTGLGSSNVSMFSDEAGLGEPDGDTSYVFGSPPALDFYSLVGQLCFGLILAVAVAGCARQVSGAPALQFLCQGDPLLPGNIVQVGANYAVPPVYRTFQAVQQASLKTGGAWNDRDLANSYWGLGTSTTAPGTLRVTQMYFEKIVSLRNVPYDCGQTTFGY